jgi:hypothetical protein
MRRPRSDGNAEVTLRAEATTMCWAKAAEASVGHQSDAEDSVVDLVGRDREMAQLRAFLVACQDGPSALSIEGEPVLARRLCLMRR